MKVVKSRAFKDRLKGHKESVICLHSPFGHEGHFLYSISKDGSVRGWDLGKREITIKALLDKKIKTREEKEEEGAFDAEGREEKKVGLTSIQEEQSKALTKEQIVSACFTQNSVFGSFEDGTIIEWNFTNQGDVRNHYIGHSKRISNLMTLGKNMLVSGSHDGTIRTWNTETGEGEAVYKTTGIVNLIRGEGRSIYAVISRSIFYHIDTVSNKVVKSIKFNKHSITCFFCMENILVFGNIDNKMLIYDLATFDPAAPQKFTPRKMIEGLGGWILTMEFSGGYLYTGCDDRKIRIYKWPEIDEVQELAEHDDGVISLSFADNMLYSGSFDHSIRSWDIKEMMQRIAERTAMGYEDLESKKYEVYYNVVFKNKKKKLPAKKKK